MNPAISNLILSLGLMQVARKIDFEDPQVLLYVRIAYVASQLISLGAYYYVSWVIKSKNDTKVLKYVEPKAPMSQEPAQAVTTTNRDYDLGEVQKAIRGVLMGCLFMAGMHLYMKYTQPLFMQAIMPLKSLYESNVVQIHLLGKSATGTLKRPFAAPASFMSPAKTEEPVEEKKAVEGKKEK
ncbi:inorganic phosphate transporter [Pseudohyphozyma bogoriensis]|nr:inorganic phosphate transporter [Pseudohyphozyma bogoriensis]